MSRFLSPRMPWEGSAMPRTACLSEEKLMAFHVGTLAEADLDAAADHLEACPDCRERIAALDEVTDPVLSALQSTSVSASQSSSSKGPAPSNLLEPPRGPD